MASILGYTNSRSASNAWSAIKQKIFTSKDGAPVAVKRGAKAGAKAARNGEVHTKAGGQRGVKTDGDGDNNAISSEDERKGATKKTTAGKKRAAPAGGAGREAKRPRRKGPAAVKQEDAESDEAIAAEDMNGESPARRHGASDPQEVAENGASGTMVVRSEAGRVGRRLSLLRSP